jgi:hypothetical protein
MSDVGREDAAEFRAGRLTPAGYFVPVHRVESAWVEHAPFAAAVIDLARPRLVVELGTHRGYSYFAFCEAVKRLGLPTRAVAVDSWEGDEHAGFYDDSVYRNVVAVNTSDYAAFSELRRGYFDDVRPSVADGSVDLLHIDGRHRYEDVRHDFETWLPAMSERGVMLFHDTNEYRTGFGVHRFWDEVSERFPSFQFLHAHGLGVLGVGAELPSGIVDFFAEAAAAPDAVRREFERLGVDVRRRMDLERLPQKLEVVEGRLAAETTARAAAERAGERAVKAAREQRRRATRLEGALRDLHESTSWRVTAPLRMIGAAKRRRRGGS